MSNNSPSSLPPQSQEVRVQNSTTPSIYDKAWKQVFDVLAQSKTSETSQVVADTQKTLNPLKSEVLAQAKAEFVKDNIYQYANAINVSNAYLAENNEDAQKELTELNSNLKKSIDISKKLSSSNDVKQIQTLLTQLFDSDKKMLEWLRKFLLLRQWTNQWFITWVISDYNNYQLDKVKLPACKKLADAGLQCPIDPVSDVRILQDEPNWKVDVYQLALLNNMTLLQQTLPRAIYNVNAIKSNIDNLIKKDTKNTPKLKELSNRLAWINLQMRDMQNALKKDWMRVVATYFPWNFISDETEAQARKQLDATFSKLPTWTLTQQQKAIDLALDFGSLNWIINDEILIKQLKDLELTNEKIWNSFVIFLSALLDTIEDNFTIWGNKWWTQKLWTFASTWVIPTDDQEFARFVKNYPQIIDFFNIFPDNFKNFPYTISKDWEKPLDVMYKLNNSEGTKKAYEKAKALQNK